MMQDTAMEELVAEFLQSKGIHDAYNQLTASSESKPVKDRIVTEILELVDAMQWDDLRHKWETLNENLFNSLTIDQSILATEFESDLYKLYLIRCISKGEKKRCLNFFAEMSSYVNNNAAWSDWLRLPYVAEPREHDSFKKYFSKQWREVFSLSLHNFFNLVLSGRSQSLLSTLAERQPELTPEPVSPTRSEHGSIAESISGESANDQQQQIMSDLSPALGPIVDELLDEFAVIAQCSGPLRNSSKQSLKSIIKNISSKKLSDDKDRGK